MTASAYLVNFKINLGDLAEVALIWPDIYIYIILYTEYTYMILDDTIVNDRKWAQMLRKSFIHIA